PLAVRQMKTALTVVVAIEFISDGLAVLDLDSGPIRKISVDLYPVQSYQLRYRANAFVAADILSHLHIVIVGVSVLHRLEAAVELGVVLVHEEVSAVPAHEFGGGTAFRRVLAGSPFVPVVDIKVLGVALDCFVPSLLEINAVAF